MDISIFGLKLNLEILILIGIIYLIMVTHTICSCCNMNKVMEGLENLTKPDTKNNKPKTMPESNLQTASQNMSSVPASTEMEHNLMNDKNGSNMSNEKDESLKEGFIGYDNSPAQYTLGDYSAVDTSSWGVQDLVVLPGSPLSPGVNNILNRPKQSVPLPEGEMLLFANTPFKSECCPSAYSNSSGCACVTVDQYNYLVTRGGNNVPYSEY